MPSAAAPTNQNAALKLFGQKGSSEWSLYSIALYASFHFHQPIIIISRGTKHCDRNDINYPENRLFHFLFGYLAVLTEIMKTLNTYTLYDKVDALRG